MNNKKKTPKKQLEKFSTIFMQIGLVLSLFIAYVILEYQTEQELLVFNDEDTPNIFVFEPEQNVIFTKEAIKKPKVDIPKKTKFILDEPVKTADNEFVEKVVLSEPDDDITMVDINSLETVDEPIETDPEDEVDFLIIENAPVFRGCEGLSKAANKKCFNKKMKQFVQRNFDIELANDLGLSSGKYRISTQFIIDNQGNIIDIKINAPHKRLQKEANRLLNKLPKFTPGKQRNKPVKVKYRLPINFRVN